MALSPRQRGGRPTASRRPGVDRGSVAGGPPSAGTGDAGEQPRPRRRPLRRPAKRGGSDGGIPPALIRVGIIVAIVLIGGVVKLATAKPAGDTRYWERLVTMTNSLGKGNIHGLNAIREQVNGLPIRDVTDPKLKKMHGMLQELVAALESDDGSPDSMQRIRGLCTRIDDYGTQLNSTYGR